MGKHPEGAIEMAAKSVESVMRVLLDERGKQRNGKETANALFDMLWRSEICPRGTLRRPDRGMTAKRLWWSRLGSNCSDHAERPTSSHREVICDSHHFSLRV